MTRPAVQNALSIAALVALASCGSAPAAGGRPTATAAPTPAEPSEVAIAEPETDIAVADEPVPMPTREADADIAGEWVEDWPDRGGCADTIYVRAIGGRLELSGSDCNDDEPYEYKEVELDGKRLSFKLRVKSTDRLLDYRLELKESGELVGPVTGGAEATVTWRRKRP